MPSRTEPETFTAGITTVTVLVTDADNPETGSVTVYVNTYVPGTEVLTIPVMMTDALIFTAPFCALNPGSTYGLPIRTVIGFAPDNVIVGSELKVKSAT